MSDQSERPNGAIPSPDPVGETPAPAAPSLRETIEQAYDEIAESPDSTPSGQDGRPRDTSGRFVAKERTETGEAEQPKAPPSPEKLVTEAQKPPVDPAAAPPARSNQPPEHWSAEDRANFEKLPPESKAFLLKRHTEMEADYTRKSQAASGAVQFAQTLTPVFTDPVIMGSLQQEGVSPAEAISQWAGFHKRAMSPDVRERINLLVDLSQRIGLDPARLFAMTQQPSETPQLSPQDAANPAIKYFVDHLGRTTNDLQALRAELTQMRQAEQQQRENETLEQTKWGIDQFASEKGANGQPLRPHFDAALPIIIELFKANPERDLQEAYEQAVWANPETRKLLLDAERQSQVNRSNVDRAKLAARGNTRGLTSPVSKPNAQPGKGTLRDTLEQAADEVGFN